MPEERLCHSEARGTHRQGRAVGERVHYVATMYVYKSD